LKAVRGVAFFTVKMVSINQFGEGKSKTYQKTARVPLAQFDVQS